MTEDFGYGKSFKAAFGVAFFSTIFGAIFNFLYLGFINPAPNESRLEQRLAALENSGMAGDKLDHAEAMTRTRCSAWDREPSLPDLRDLIGVILALIIAGFPDPSGHPSPKV